MFKQAQVGRQMDVAEPAEQADDEDRSIETNAAGPGQAAR